jgi:hypothetical protein
LEIFFKKKNRKTISKRKEKTLPKSCVLAPPREFVKPLVQELYWEKENFKKSYISIASQNKT